MLKFREISVFRKGKARPGQAGGGLPRLRRSWEFPMRQLLLDFAQAPAPTFENFVHGGNAELFHALESAARGEVAERVLYMWGENGAGKTHLARAFEQAVQ